MPISYSIDPARRVVYAEAFGRLCDSEIKEYQARLREDPSFERDLSQLFDCRRIEDLRVSVAGLRAFSRRSPFARNARRAIVAGRDLVFGMARMFEMLGDGSHGDTRVFRELDEARRWLGLDERVASASLRTPANPSTRPVEDDFPT